MASLPGALHRMCRMYMYPVYCSLLPALPVACRLYIEAYTADPSQFEVDAQEVLKSIIGTALETSQLQKFTGREKPTVIT